MSDFPTSAAFRTLLMVLGVALLLLLYRLNRRQTRQAESAPRQESPPADFEGQLRQLIEREARSVEQLHEMTGYAVPLIDSATRGWVAAGTAIAEQGPRGEERFRAVETTIESRLPTPHAGSRPPKPREVLQRYSQRARQRQTDGLPNWKADHEVESDGAHLWAHSTDAEELALRCRVQDDQGHVYKRLLPPYSPGTTGGQGRWDCWFPADFGGSPPNPPSPGDYLVRWTTGLDEILVTKDEFKFPSPKSADDSMRLVFPAYEGNPFVTEYVLRASQVQFTIHNVSGQLVGTRLRCEVYDPDGIRSHGELPAVSLAATFITGPPNSVTVSYPTEFRGAPALQDGLYRVKWEARLLAQIGPPIVLRQDAFRKEGERLTREAEL